LNFEDFCSKLAVIQSDFLSVDSTLDIKRDLFGGKRMQHLTENELDKLMNAYRWAYRTKLKKGI
jgi:hypothetical protein|tara:strand:- start:3258 stop:3449 length:192 start_codon:yes stop_codon:yes gene_type:complete